MQKKAKSKTAYVNYTNIKITVFLFQKSLVLCLVKKYAIVYIQNQLIFCNIVTEELKK